MKLEEEAGGESSNIGIQGFVFLSGIRRKEIILTVSQMNAMHNLSANNSSNVNTEQINHDGFQALFLNSKNASYILIRKKKLTGI